MKFLKKLGMGVLTLLILSLPISNLLILSSCSNNPSNTEVANSDGENITFGGYTKVISDEDIDVHCESVYFQYDIADHIGYGEFNVGTWVDSDGQSYRLFFDGGSLVYVVSIENIK